MRYTFLLACLVLAGCTAGEPQEPALFNRLPATATGIAFVNEVPIDTAFNIINYPYYYDGGGIAAGDVNNDGLVDLYFTANRGPNRLYLNRGDFVFEDVTEQAGVAGTADWTKGVTMADVNARQRRRPRPGRQQRQRRGSGLRKPRRPAFGALLSHRVARR